MKGLFGIFSSFNIIFIIVGVITIGIFVLTFLLIFSPKLRAKMMGNQIKATKYMLDENKENLTDIATTTGDVMIKSGKSILDNNEDALTEMATKKANIKKESIEITTRAIKDGLTKDKIYCKYCGESIDEDSEFCKKCGKKIK